MVVEQHLGERIARLEQRVDDIDKRVGDVGAIAVNVGILTERMDSLSKDIKAISIQLTSEIGQRNEREKDNRKERHDIKVALWSFSVMIICALIGAAAIVLSTVH